MVYLIIFLFFCACIYLFDYKRYTSGNMVMYVLSCAALIAIAGLRYRIGGDSIGYERVFGLVPPIYDLSSVTIPGVQWEPAFMIMVSLTKTFTDDFTYFQLIHAFIVNPIIFWFIFKNTQNKFVAALLYYVCAFLNFNTEILRESLAVCIFLLAWPLYRDGKWLYYYAVAVVAFFFHMSSSIMLFFPLLTLPGVRECFRLGYRTIFISMGVFVIAFMVQRTFFSLIQSLEITEAMTMKAEEYSQNIDGGANINIVGMLEIIIKNVLIPVSALLFMRIRVIATKDKTRINVFRKMETLIVTGVYFAFVTMWISLATRFNNYVCLFNYVMIASCFFTTLPLKKSRRLRIPGFYWLCILGLIVVVNINVYLGPTYGSQSNKRYMIYYPYSSRFDQKEDYKREEIYRYAAHRK